MMDILFFLFITIFFIFKLKNVFGTRNEDNNIRKKTIEEFLKKNIKGKNGYVDVLDTNAKVIDINNQLNQINKNIKISLEIPDNIKKELVKINFNENNFLKGSENAVEMINEAFSNKDIDTLKSLLSKNIFDNFKQQIQELESKNRVLKSSLISFISSKIENIFIKNKVIFIDVIFEMEQINFVEDKDGNIIMGDRKRIEKIKEKWTFERKNDSKTNFWIVDNIENIN